MTFFVPIILIAASIGTFFLYVNPTYQTVKAEQVQESALSEANANAVTLRAERSKLIDDMNNISSEDRDKLQKALPDNIENVDLIININNIALQHNMKIKNARIGDPTAVDKTSAGPSLTKYGTVSLSFTVSTSYDEFQSFMKDLESSLRLVDVTNLSFSPSDNGRYDFNVTLQTYWLK